jgi:hypothetical protein
VPSAYLSPAERQVIVPRGVWTDRYLATLSLARQVTEGDEFVISAGRVN